MRKQVQILYSMLMCTVLLVLGTGSSNNSQGSVISSDGDKSLLSTYNENINLLSEFFDVQLGNSIEFVPEDQLIPTWTKDIDIRDYLLSPSDISRPHNYDIEQLMVPTEQIDTLSYLHSTFNNSSTEYPLAYCISNGPAQEYTRPKSLKRHHQSSKTNKLEQTMEENTSRKKQKKTNKSTANSLEKDCADNSILNNNKLKRIRNSIGIWNNARLKNRHREALNLGYRPVILFNRIKNNYKYIKIDNIMHQPLIETHVKNCKAIYSEILVQNEFWFAIVSRTSRINTKLIDCQAINMHPSDYKYIEGLSGYYSDLPGDIVRYMDKHGPIVSKQARIKTEWTETLGDIYVRKPIESEYGINKESVICKGTNEYISLHTAVQMILALPEVHKDLLNITVEFIEKTLKAKLDSNHYIVIKALHEIVEQQKSSTYPELDREYALFYNIFASILQQTCVSSESMVIQLYTEMYKSLVYFYKKAEVCEEIILDIEKKRRKTGKKKNTICLQESTLSSSRSTSSAL